MLLPVNAASDVSELAAHGVLAAAAAVTCTRKSNMPLAMAMMAIAVCRRLRSTRATATMG